MLPLVGQREMAGAAREQRAAKVLFQRADLLAHRRLAQVQLLATAENEPRSTTLTNTCIASNRSIGFGLLLE